MATPEQSFVVQCKTAPPRLRLIRWPLLAAQILVLLLSAAQAEGVNDLVLNVVSGSERVQIGDLIKVRLDVVNLAQSINGVQAFLHYDEMVMSLLNVAGHQDVGAGWTAITATREGGDVVQFLVMLGGAASDDHTVATLTFKAIGVGTSLVTLLPGDPPTFTKLTSAADASAIIPTTWDSGDIVVMAPGIPAASEWGLGVLMLLLLTAGTLLMRRDGDVAGRPAFAYVTLGRTRGHEFCGV